jgi:hypothetical protein
MEIERMFLLMLHVLCVMGAAVGIAFADLSLFKGKRVDKDLLRQGCHLVFGMLCLLWLSGLMIIWIDTGFDMQVIATKPKLIAKVAVAVLLSLNGYLLHRCFFDTLLTPPLNLRLAVNTAAGLAAISGSSWVYAVFLGLAKPLARFVTLAGFAGIFVALLTLSGVVVALLVRPRLLGIYQRQHDATTRCAPARRAVDLPWVTPSRARLMSTNSRNSS